MIKHAPDYVYATVAYADVFDYPLTADDIYFWSIRKPPRKNLRSLHRVGLVRQHQFIILKGRQSIVKKATIRHQCSKEKWRTARRVGTLLRMIPTIKLVGVTGGLAMNNADERDDIDLFFITSRGTIWISRLLATIFVDMMGLRRKPKDRHVANKICLNMFMSEDTLTVEAHEQDLFSAHEVLQMEPLWARATAYKQFLTKNAWVQKYLPIAWNIKKVAVTNHPKKTHWWSRFAVVLLRFFEAPVRTSQLWYMAHHRTSEIISDGILRFHPRDARKWIKAEFGKRLKRRNMPLDNIFYAR